MRHIQNKQISIGKSIPNVCDIQKNHTLGYGFTSIENLQPSLWVLFFVISSSEAFFGFEIVIKYYNLAVEG